MSVADQAGGRQDGFHLLLPLEVVTGAADHGQPALDDQPPAQNHACLADEAFGGELPSLDPFLDHRVGHQVAQNGRLRAGGAADDVLGALPLRGSTMSGPSGA